MSAPFEEESLFSRDIDGRLIRLDKATEAMLNEEVTIVIDDRALRVKRAVHAVDEQGRPLFNELGLAVPRATTIYDAAEFLTDALPARDNDGTILKDEDGREIYRPRKDDEPRATKEELHENPIPILCHQTHLEPVAVCRACVVEVSIIKRGKRRTQNKLLPACQHRVEDDMVIRTAASPDSASSGKVKKAVKMVVELLAADHPTPCAKEQKYPGSCELEAIARKLEIKQPRFPSRTDRKQDNSSLLINVDHAACILCDRCIRSCNDVKEYHVIGRMLKGYDSQIAFDLNAPMGSSSCRSCGECMFSCPTGALTFRKPVGGAIFEGLDPPSTEVTLEELYDHPDPEIQRAFSRVTRPFLQFNIDAVVRRKFEPGQLICRQGEFGATAYFIESGDVEIFIRNGDFDSKPEKSAGFFGFLRGGAPARNARTTTHPRDFYLPDAHVALTREKPTAILGQSEIVGEMACLNGYPRSADVIAGPNGCTVLEMRRNVLDILRRSRSFRERMDRKVRDHVVNTVLKTVPLFSKLDEKQLKDLAGKARYRRADPKEVIIRQGESAMDTNNPLAEGMFLVWSGFVRVVREMPGGESDVNYLGPGAYFGEIALLAAAEPSQLGITNLSETQEMHEIHALAEAGIRTATCSALDHVELVQISPADFREVLIKAEPAVREGLIKEALVRLRGRTHEAHADSANRTNEQANVGSCRHLYEAFGHQGLMNAQSLLVLDLLKCTRCDECSKACSDTHGNVTRLIRDGLRFDKYLVAGSCRSCRDPVCIPGCPVDAIHRSPGSIEIQISENRCIGCGRCAENCPYGNINMHLTEKVFTAELLQIGADVPHVARKATTCDQCHSLPGHAPNCVVACPHDAAHRMDGSQLWKLVQEATNFTLD